MSTITSPSITRQRSYINTSSTAATTSSTLSPIQLHGKQRSVAALAKIYENPRIMAIKRRFDLIDENADGVLTRTEFIKNYDELCAEQRM